MKAAGKGLEECEYRIQVSVMDCTGCGVCAEVCPGKRGNKAICDEINRRTIRPKEKTDYAMSLSPKEDLIDRFSVKGLQFVQPLIEFSENWLVRVVAKLHTSNW